jgi:hypothetical protein
MGKIIITMILALLIFPIVSAGVPPPHANFKIDVNEFNLPDGDWTMSIILLKSYGLSEKQALENFNNFKLSYLEAKNECGLKTDFVYVDEARQECAKYKQYVGNPWSDHVLKFNDAHYNYFINERRNGSNIRSFYPYKSELNDTTFYLEWISQGTEGPYIIVLEKIDSNDEIYFSELININWEKGGPVQWDEWEENTYDYNLVELELQDNNKLLINFGEEPPTLSPNQNYLIYWIIGGIILLAVIFLLILKIKR